MAAGAAALEELKIPSFYEGLEGKAQKFFAKLSELAEAAPIDATVNSIASMGTVFFTPGPVRDYDSAKQSQTRRFAQFFHGMLKRGIYLPPAQFECMFVSAAHTQEDLETALQAAEETLQEID
jgi:glutamate-1-semialdehyde 2,1-aminomutase